MHAWTGRSTFFSTLGKSAPTILSKHALVWTIMSINVFSTPGCMVMPAAAEMCLITLICCCWLLEGSVAFAQNVLVSPCLPHGICKKRT